MTTDRETIQAIRERIRVGKPLPGDKAMLALLLRGVSKVYDMPAGQTRPAGVDGSAWTKNGTIFPGHKTS